MYVLVTETSNLIQSFLLHAYVGGHRKKRDSCKALRTIDVIHKAGSAEQCEVGVELDTWPDMLSVNKGYSGVRDSHKQLSHEMDDRRVKCMHTTHLHNEGENMRVVRII